MGINDAKGVDTGSKFLPGTGHGVMYSHTVTYIESCFYLCTPYSHCRMDVMVARYEVAHEILAYLHDIGEMCFSPIVHSHKISMNHGGQKASYNHWRKFDEHMMLSCGELLFASVPGYEESYGMSEELSFAEKHGINVHKVDPTVDFKIKYSNALLGYK